MKKALSLILALVLCLSLWACGGGSSTDNESSPGVTPSSASPSADCKHNYQERDGRVVCLDCKEICTHSYQIQGTDAFCTNCLFSCKHNFTADGKEMVCSSCGIKCVHVYACVDGVYQCKHCAIPCEHEYVETNNKRVCKKCGSEQVMLTLENINDYFSVNVKIYDVSIEENWILTKDKGEASADITVTNKKGVKYNNVVLTIVLETSSGGWMNQARNVEIAYDGTGELTFSFSSKTEDYVSKNPTFKAKITGVTGEIAY